MSSYELAFNYGAVSFVTTILGGVLWLQGLQETSRFRRHNWGPRGQSVQRALKKFGVRAALVGAANLLISLILVSVMDEGEYVGEVVSITDAGTGKVICVQRHSTNQTRCGQVLTTGVAEQLQSVRVGDCVQFALDHDLVDKLEPRPC